MTIDASQLESFDGKDVLLTLDSEEDAIEGRVESGSEVGVAFKRKGKRDIDLILPGSIVSIELAPTKPTVIKTKSILVVPVERIRTHLVDRHGWNLSTVNALTNEEAELQHNKVDHSDLGHEHTKAPESDEA